MSRRLLNLQVYLDHFHGVELAETVLPDAFAERLA